VRTYAHGSSRDLSEPGHGAAAIDGIPREMRHSRRHAAVAQLAEISRREGLLPSEEYGAIIDSVTTSCCWRRA
jgi:hypothetical protein